MLRKRLPMVCLLLAPALAGSGARAQSTVLLSATAGGTEGSQNSSYPCISANGRFVAFVSSAPNLVTLDTNSAADVFLRDLQAKTISRISVSSSGAQANGASAFPSMSADGRYIAFQSAATNLVPGKGQGIYLRDTQTSQTSYIAAGTNPAISADGATVAFVSTAALVAADTNGFADVYTAQRSTGAISLVSVATDGSLGTGDSGLGGIAINADGSVVAFQSLALNLDPAGTNTAGDVFVRDRTAGQTTRVSVANDGNQADHGCSVPAISADGNLVAFETGATNLVAGDTNTSIDVFVRDRTALTTVRVSLSSTGAEITNDSRHPTMSADGQYVTFESDSPDVVPGKTNGVVDVFVRDTLGQTTARVSLTSAGAQIDLASYHTALSLDGRYVAFTSEGTNVVPGLSGNNNNVFARGPLVDTPGDLAFTTQPAGAAAGKAFTAQPVLEARNLDGTLKWDYADPVTVAIKSGTGRTGAALSGTTTLNAVNGVAAFTDLAIDLAGSGYLLTASSGTLGPADSAAFDVQQTPTKLAFSVEPAGASAGLAFTTQPVVQVQDAEGNLVPSYSGTATIAIQVGSGRAGAVLSGTLSVPITAGTATCTDLAISLAGTGYVLTASAGSLAPASTAAFNVAQTPTTLAFSTQPAGASAGLAFATQPVVQVKDAEGNVVLSYGGSVSLAIKAGTGRSGAALSGTTTVNAVNGTATFTNLSINLAGTGYVLSAASVPLAAADSAAFAVAQTPTKLVIAVQPAGAAAGKAFATQPVVQVRDAEDNVVTAYTGPVTLAVKAGTGRPGAVLSGTTTLSAASGVASFAGLSIDLAGAGYVLTASSGTLPATDTLPFAVAQTPTKLVFSVQPSGAAAGVAFATQPVVQVKDAEDNVVAGYSGAVTMVIKFGSGRPGATLNGTVTATVVNGAAAFTDLSIGLAGTGYVLTAASGALPSVDSAAFAVAQTPTKLVFATQPAGATAGLAFTTQPVVQVRDAEDNVVAAYSGPVTVALKAGSGTPGAVLSGTATVNATAGVAAFSGLGIDRPGTGYLLTASSGTLPAVDSGGFAVLQPPYTMADVGKALRWAAGMAAAGPVDLLEYNVEFGGASAGRVDMADAQRIARKAAGLEPNP